MRRRDLITALPAALAAGAAVAGPKTGKGLASASLAVKDAGGVFRPMDRYVTPAGHKVGDGSMPFEGPGWESDKVAYRFYLDDRSVTDVFGKLVPDRVLDHVGQGPSYHQIAPWGMDVLHVGESLGMGGLGLMRGGKATWQGPAASRSAQLLAPRPGLAGARVTAGGLQAEGLRFDLLQDYVIEAGSWLTQVSAHASRTEAPLAAGLIKHEGVEVLRDPGGTGRAGFIATFGPQSEVKDGLGLVLFHAPDQEVGDDGSSLFVRFPDGRALYAFAGLWSRSPGAPQSAQALAEWAREAARTVRYRDPVRPPS